MTNDYPSLASVGRRKANIQIIPLIDVVFFLLATFVLFTLCLNKLISLPVTLPVGDPKETPNHSVVLQVTDAGIFWDKDLITDKELSPRLAEYVKSTKEPRILVAGDEKAKYGPTVAVLDEVRKAGISAVSIETTYRATGK
jgi:biopolymer transport protein ExbD